LIREIVNVRQLIASVPRSSSLQNAELKKSDDLPALVAPVVAEFDGWQSCEPDLPGKKTGLLAAAANPRLSLKPVVGHKRLVPAGWKQRWQGGERN
jgi:hypothetical protein